MQIEIKKKDFEKIAPILKQVKIESGRQMYDEVALDLADMNVTQLEFLVEVLPSIPKQRNNISDIRFLIDARKNPIDLNFVSKTLVQFRTALHEVLQKTERHWLFIKEEEEAIAYLARPPAHHEAERTAHGGYRPEHVTLSAGATYLRKQEEKAWTFYAAHIRGKKMSEVLDSAGIVLASSSLLASYDKEHAKFVDFINKPLGFQMLASGKAEKDRNSWYWKTTYIIGTQEEPGRVVLDDFSEDESHEKAKPSPGHLWAAKNVAIHGKKDEDIDTVEPGEEEAPPEMDHVPHIPLVRVFDMRRHEHTSVHVARLEPYKYNPKLADKLVMDADNRRLIDTLLNTKLQFKDIIAKKGNGAVILCAGPPGVGKTLTAEVYSEAVARPLYSVQCSQLGTNEEALEKALDLCFARSIRWNAILLLDEADVYVAKRGTSIQQNAIVGVFLRTLEYFQGIMFMTTNRTLSVDDAISSRCLARVEYSMPTSDEQRRIWRILADGAGIVLSDKEIERIVKDNNELSGRDIKQLLKLASFTGVTAENISAMRRFKPTQGE